MADRVRVVLDAMGGDNAPAAIVEGGLQALAADPGLELVLVGREEVVRPLLKGATDRVTVVHADDVVEMDEHPAAAVRSKKKSSINVGCQLVAAGNAEAFVSAGNSGAVLAAATLVVKRLPGVSRPAIGTPVPTKAGVTLLLDAGANTEVKPEYLVEWALLGDAYARRVLGLERPRVGLLSNGEEEGKGDELVVAAYPRLRELPINFVGNIEGKAMVQGAADVVVTDGFTGNVVLKTIEGVAEFILSGIRDAAMSSLTGKLGGLLLRPNLKPLREKADWRKHGGAPLLGVNGVVIIAHGRSDAEAAKNAVLRGAEAARNGLVRSMADAMGARPEGSPVVSPTI